MRFTRLRLAGFKSFVDPTDLIIGSGLTGVVGPNGCGKSNLLEALRWVMGENRPTAMRGGGMEDVIFAGAASRGARNFAEVTIHLDNTDRLAPAGFNDSDQIEIIRRITRDLGSAYQVNGKDVRARDVQMLFADASTGAHSPALVRQGQISELINARPKARRRILEEAAGISGLYQRRHEAELKLKGAEANLARVDDTVGQLAGQLATLARQAKQAARYRAIGEDLRTAEGMLLYRRWREADLALTVARNEWRERSAAAANAEAAARKAVKARSAADEALPALREEEGIATAVLQRLTLQQAALVDQETTGRARIEMLEARIAQLLRDMQREGDLNRDAGDTLVHLEREQAELAMAAEGYDDRLAAAAEMAREASDILEAREADLAALTEAVARLAAQHQSAQRLLQDSRKTLERSEVEAARARAAVAQSHADMDKASRDFAAAAQAEQAAQGAAEVAEAAEAAADAARSDSQAREAEARTERSEAEGELSALSAEVTALARLLEQDKAAGGQILDDLQVQPGYEKALGAALSDDLRAPQVTADGPSGWAELPGYDTPQTLPEGVLALSRNVSAPDVLTRRMGQIGLVDCADGLRLQPLLKPGQRLVSIEGDLWRWDGYRAWAADGPSAAALRLQQLNRLEELKQTMIHATARAEAARATYATLSHQLSARAEADKSARAARRAADAAVSDAARALSRAEADHTRAKSKLEALGLAVTRHEDEALVARGLVAEAEKGLAALGDLDSERARVEDIKMTVEAARITMLTRRSAHDDLRREGEARAARAQAVAKDLDGWRHRLQTAEKRSQELAARKQTTEAELQEAASVPARLAAERGGLTARIAAAETRQTAARAALSAGEAVLRQTTEAERTAERAAGEAREIRARSEARTDAASEARKAASQRIADELDTTPEALLATLAVDVENMPAADAIEADVNRLKRQRDALGAVNLRAEEDAKEIAAEHGTLASEKADLEEAIKALRSGIAGLNREGRERLLTAFEQVNANFSMLFRHLFGGGEASLVLVESDDPLEAGLEIMCQPPGKKLATLSLLSGGEQTLTALALIFGVFLANPAPICVLDEVDAPLDDANVARFCDLLDEMRRRTETRFLIITHNAVTMSRMDRLFGVTMAEQGVSQLVSVDLSKAEALVG